MKLPSGQSKKSSSSLLDSELTLKLLLKVQAQIIFKNTQISPLQWVRSRHKQGITCLQFLPCGQCRLHKHCCWQWRPPLLRIVFHACREEKTNTQKSRCKTIRPTGSPERPSLGFTASLWKLSSWLPGFEQDLRGTNQPNTVHWRRGSIMCPGASTQKAT